MKTLKERWLRYRDAAYPGGISGDQEAQLHQAWFACAFEILNGVIIEVAALPDHHAEVALQTLANEALRTCEERADGVKGHN